MKVARLIVVAAIVVMKAYPQLRKSGRSRERIQKFSLYDSGTL